MALARALVIEPPLLMFDEPLSNLDAKLRVDMRVEIRKLQRANGTTSLYVTHDQEEAFSISDRVAIMNAGRIMQLDTPEVLYQRPANAFVRRFRRIREPHCDDRQGPRRRSGHGGGPGGATVTLSEADLGPIPDRFVLATRADGLSVQREGTGIPVELGLRTYLGRAYQYETRSSAGSLIANGSLAEPFAPGDRAVLVPKPEQCCILKPEA